MVQDEVRIRIERVEWDMHNVEVVEGVAYMISMP
jgi:hypothetical protein